MLTRRQLLSGAVTASVIPLFPRFTQAAPEPQYLAFQLFTQPTSPYPTSVFDSRRILRLVDDIIARCNGLKGDGVSRQLGIVLGPLCLDHPDDVNREIIRTGFSIARTRGVAIGFHLDDSMWWKRRTDLWNDPANIEWTNWSGAPSMYRIIGWYPWALAPTMNFYSAALRNGIASWLSGVIALEINAGLAASVPSLFAGIIGGWESRLDGDPFAPGAPGLSSPVVGYHALSLARFSAANPPRDFAAETDKVLLNWMQWWANQLRGLLASPRIYTHRAGTDSLAFGTASRPGFTLYANPSGISTTIAHYGTPAWGMCEGTNIPSTDASWRTYLSALFNAGARLVTIFGWEDTGQYGTATRSAEASAAYQTFLAGGTL